MKNKIFSSILLDVGGTTIKGNAVVDGLTILPQMIVVPSISSYSKEEIILNIYRTIERIKENALIDTIDGISFAFPGPFDYEKGISYIKDVGKYDSLYKASIESELKRIDREGILTHSSFIFMNDIDAFSYGVLEEYETLKEGKTLFIAIGTGTGSSFSIDGIIRTEGEGIPQNGWIYSIPYKESIVDDYISARGLENIAEEIMGRRLDGSSLSILASYGNKEAVKVYEKFGRTIGEALLPIINTFNPERIVFGGNITKANKFFAPSLKSVVDIPVIFVEETSCYTFKGLERAQRRKHGIQI